MGLNTIFGSFVGNVFDSVFGSVNPGSYDASGRFVPGDLQTRIQKVKQFLYERGLSETDVNMNDLINALYVPSGWQGAITSYLDQVAYDKKNATSGNLHDFANPYPNTNQGAGANYIDPRTTLASVGLGGGWTFLIIIGLIFAVLSSK